MPNMNMKQIAAARGAGFTMIEVLVSLLIIVLGLLGLAGLQSRMQQAEFESYQRTQALVMLYDMVDRIQVHRVAASCFRVTTDAAAGTPFIGTGGSVPGSCGATGGPAALTALGELHQQLLGAGETKGGSSVGSITGARGCVSYDAGSEVAGAPGTGIYTVTVAWQGGIDTVAPAVACADAEYTSLASRRAVSTTFRLAKLN
jgi:type IV pilus assembly protein PilV